MTVTDEPAPEGGFDLGATGARIEALIDASSAHGHIARERSEELVRLVADLYGAGLERMLDVLHDAGRLDDAALAALAGDELVSGLLLVHGLHPYDVGERVAAALDSVRPFLGSHGGDVEYLGIDDEGVVKLALLGSCDGCPSSSVTLKLAVETAVLTAAPEVTGIVVDDAPGAAPAAKGVIPIAALRSRLDPPHQYADAVCPAVEVVRT
jgi:Fe-S cluster biogenesis protein NfuA